MYVRVMSDLHQEFGPLGRIPAYPEDKHTVMILAGDIGLAGKTHTYIPLLKECNERFAQTIYVLGNHDYWRTSLLRARDKIQEAVDDEELTKIQVWDEGGIYTRYKVAFLGCTLWTDYDKENHAAMVYAQQAMNDYHFMRTGSPGDPYKRKVKPLDLLAMHVQQRDWLLKEIKRKKNAGYRVVVVTHHLPSWTCIPEQFKGERLNCCYASELGYQIDELEPEVWIHGHTHDSHDFELAATRIICNPRGYEGHELNPDFKIRKRFEV